ncbi:ricin-type beta-trefoil lectin domain protein [Streptomyces varsoviensis]|uniref:ricin-type beta-trefoil lectin domain protein n=1 Tax=Streptomyces varsoviensis TaxID=67373 RepID=UPI0007C59438|nr:ricin-type beta-trefoil lectin domain protein [Streptomyces varsoviensis]
MKKTAAWAAAAMMAGALLTATGSAQAEASTGSVRAVDTAHSSKRVAGRYCLANDWGTSRVSAKPCNPSDQGQQWVVSGHQIALAHARAYCLANTWETPEVAVKPCSSGDQGQYWNVSGQQVSLNFAPAYCLANAWGTPAVSTKPCAASDNGQHWVIFNDQISLALA